MKKKDIGKHSCHVASCVDATEKEEKEMKKCTELARFAGKSVVEIRNTENDKVCEYVLCNNFDNSKAYGDKWTDGTYFNVCCSSDQEIQLKAAMLMLYNVETHKIGYERMKELAKKFLSLVDVDDEMEYLRDKMTENEAEYFGIKEKIFPKLYKVVKCTFIRKQEATAYIIMPNDEDECCADNYIDKDYLEDNCEIETDDWELDYYNAEYKDLTAEDVEARYDSDEVWNYNDFKSGCLD